jgi:hypothetical protein
VGDLVVVVFDEEDEVGAYAWTTFTDVWMKEIGAALLLGRDETSGYDTFVLPRWRGKGLQYSLNARRFQHLSEHGHKARPELGKRTQYPVSQVTGEFTQTNSSHCLQCSNAKYGRRAEMFSRCSYQGPKTSAMA